MKNMKNKPSLFASHRSISIAYRLTVIYALSAFSILVLIVSFLYYALIKSIEDEDKYFLVNKIQNLRTLLQDEPDDIEALVKAISEESEQQFIKYYARILNESSAIVAETFNEKVYLHPKDFPPPADADTVPFKIRKKRLHEGRMYLMIAARAEEKGPAGRKYQIQTALDISREAGIIKRYRIMAYVALIVGILVSAAVGAIIARRAMRPLFKITRVVQRIRATKLSQRVNPSQWPSELTVLAISFDEMLDRLEDSFSRLSQFSSDLAHELRTPINNLIGEAEVTLARPRTIEEYKDHVESSLEEFNKLAHIIENLLFLAKAESTDIKIERSTFDPVKEIETVLEYGDAFIEERKIKVTCSGMANLTADPVLFRRIINNIMSNALHYTPQEGKVDIAVNELPDHTVTVTISDTGIGIASEDLLKIFDRFYRGSNAKSFDAQGTGLGLAIVKSIMGMHNGKVDIESNLFHGTTVTLTFPSAY